MKLPRCGTVPHDGDAAISRNFRTDEYSDWLLAEESTMHAAAAATGGIASIGCDVFRQNINRSGFPWLNQMEGGSASTYRSARARPLYAAESKCNNHPYVSLPGWSQQECTNWCQKTDVSCCVLCRVVSPPYKLPAATGTLTIAPCSLGTTNSGRRASTSDLCGARRDERRWSLCGAAAGSCSVEGGRGRMAAAGHAPIMLNVGATSTAVCNARLDRELAGAFA